MKGDKIGEVVCLEARGAESMITYGKAYQATEGDTSMVGGVNRSHYDFTDDSGKERALYTTRFAISKGNKYLGLGKCVAGSPPWRIGSFYPIWASHVLGRVYAAMSRYPDGGLIESLLSLHFQLPTDAPPVPVEPTKPLKAPGLPVEAWAELYGRRAGVDYMDITRQVAGKAKGGSDGTGDE